MEGVAQGWHRASGSAIWQAMEDAIADVMLHPFPFGGSRTSADGRVTRRRRFLSPASPPIVSRSGDPPTGRRK